MLAETINAGTTFLVNFYPSPPKRMRHFDKVLIHHEWGVLKYDPNLHHDLHGAKALKNL